jgi:hypothetical protein
MKGAVQFQNRTRANNMLVLGQLLSDSGYHDSSITTIKSAIRIATEFELPDVTLRAVTLLRLKAAMAGDSKTVANCDKLIVTAQEMLSIATEADTLFAEACVVQLQYTEHTARTTLRLQQILSRLDSVASMPNAPSILRIHWFRTRIWLATLQSDAKCIITTGQKAISFLDKHPHLEHTAVRAEFYGSQLSAQVVIGDIEETERIWDRVGALLEEGGDGWNRLLHAYVLACSTNHAYRQMRDAMWLYTTKRSAGKHLLTDHAQSICRAYVMLLIDTGRVDAGPFQNTSREYLSSIQRREDKLIGDKSHTGAALYILRILHWIRTYRFSEVIAHTESVRQYASRYLNNPKTLRTGVFFRMLATLPAADFDANEVDRRGKAILTKHTRASQLKRDFAEIIPYEELWSIVIEALRARGSQRRR